MDADLLALRDRVALVTGAGMGIGKACALLLARAGAHVVVADRDLASSERTAAEIRTLGRTAQALATDVRRAADVDAAVAAAVDGLGALDVCVHNVGGLAGQPVRDFLDTPVDTFDAIADNNLRATWLCCHAAARSMVARRVPGSIVNVASVAAIRAVRGIAAYGAAKAGVSNLTMQLAVELGVHGIRVNAVAPSTTATELIRERVQRGEFRALEEANPLRRMATPEDIAGAVLFLASDLARYVTGQTLVVDGGVASTTRRLDPPQRRP